jgi:hypothetical protein
MKKSLTFRVLAIQKRKQQNVHMAFLLLAVLWAGCGRGPSAGADQARMTPQRIQELVTLLGAKNGDSGMGFDLRIAAADQLGEVGPQAKEHGAIPALEKLSKNRDPKLRQAAVRALINIRTK